MWSLVASGFFAWLDRKAVDMSSQLFVSANPLACNAGPNAHVWTLDPLVVQLLVDVRQSFERMVVSADRACASAENGDCCLYCIHFLIHAEWKRCPSTQTTVWHRILKLNYIKTHVLYIKASKIHNKTIRKLAIHNDNL